MMKSGDKAICGTVGKLRLCCENCGHEIKITLEGLQRAKKQEKEEALKAGTPEEG
jgi:hypothetical protein